MDSITRPYEELRADNNQFMVDVLDYALAVATRQREKQKIQRGLGELTMPELLGDSLPVDHPEAIRLEKNRSKLLMALSPSRSIEETRAEMDIMFEVGL